MNYSPETLKALATYADTYDTPTQLGAIVSIEANNYNAMLVELQRKVLAGYRVHEAHPQGTTLLYVYKPARVQEEDFATLVAAAEAAERMKQAALEAATAEALAVIGEFK